MKLKKYIQLILLVFFIASCEKDPISDQPIVADTSTLDENLTGPTGFIDEYFYDLDEGQAPFVDAKFHRYSDLTMLQPQIFDEDSDTLNLRVIGDFVLSLTPEDLLASMITLSEFDETISGTDLNGDGEITTGVFNDVYREDEISFSHSYTDMIKMEWDEDNARYMVVSMPGNSSPLTHKFYVGNPNELYGDDNLPPDTVDTYDSLVYITQINYNHLNGFWFNDGYTDLNGDGNYDNGTEDTIVESLCEGTWNSEELFCDLDSDGNLDDGTEGTVEESLCEGTWNSEELFCDLDGDGNLDDEPEGTADTLCQGTWNSEESFCDLDNDGNLDDEPDQIIDDNGNGAYDDADGVWDEDEEYFLADSISGYFYFDESQLVYSDSVHSSQSVPVYHTFAFDKKVLGADSLMFKISTDCNDDGQWTAAETEDEGNNLWDPSEPFLDEDGDGSFSIGEPFLDRNCNNQWDDAEEFVDCCNVSNYLVCSDGTEGGEDPCSTVSGGSNIGDFCNTIGGTCSDSQYATVEDCEANGTCSDSQYATVEDCEANGTCSDSQYDTVEDCEANGTCSDSQYNTVEDCEANGTCSDSQHDTVEDCEANGTCSDSQYDNEIECEENDAIWSLNTWTPHAWSLHTWTAFTWTLHSWTSGGTCELGCSVENPTCEDDETWLVVMGNGIYDEGEDITDTGNGIIDGAEVCVDGSSPCTADLLYEISDKPDVLVADYGVDDYTWEAVENIDTLTVVTLRWADVSHQLIEVSAESVLKTKELPLTDKVERIYSYEFIENTWGYDNEYAIAKTTWYDDDNRSTNYHLFRKDDETGDIIQLVHDSYLVLGNTSLSNIDAGSFSDYMTYDAFPREQTYLYTKDGMLRDGEHHETYRQGFSAETFALFDIYETYEVDTDSVLIPIPNTQYDSGEDFADCCDAANYLVCSDGSPCLSVSDGGGVGDECGDGEGTCQLGCDVEAPLCEDDVGWYNSMGNGEWDEGEVYENCCKMLYDVFRITRTKRSVMLGPGVELEEKNYIWLAKSWGIVKDEMEFRFNEPDQHNSLYRLELSSCRHCDDSSSSRISGSSNPTEIGFESLNMVDQFNDNYKKSRSYGIQTISINLESGQ